MDLNFFNYSDVQQQLDVIGGPEYRDYKKGILLNKEDRILYPSQHYTLTFYEKGLGIEDDGLISYDINSSGHRCDEFKKEHDKKHALFAGCSFTFGEALPYKQNWAGMLYDKINKNNNFSGYYSLSYGGGGVDVIVDNIYKYCDTYATPDYLFILIPEIGRRYLWHKNKYFSVISPYDQPEYLYDAHQGFENALRYTVSYMKNLEIFCEKLNIKLIWSTWNPEEANVLKDINFKNFLYFQQKDIINKSDNYYDINHKYYRKGRDFSHPGLMFSNGLANIYMEKINEANIL